MQDTLLEMALGDLRESALFASLVEAAAGLFDDALFSPY